MRASELSKQLGERCESLVMHFFPNGKRHGKDWCLGSVNGEVGSSMKVLLHGEKQGRWCDFATNESGDLLDLIAQNQKITLAQAIKIAKQWLGVPETKFVAYKSNSFEKLNSTMLPDFKNNNAGFKYLTSIRKLTDETLKNFDIRTTDHATLFPSWRDKALVQIKKLALERRNGKKQIFVEKNCEPCLFGWQAMPNDARSVVLTEGEIDAMTVHQCGLPALSLPFGGGGGNKHQWLAREYDRLEMLDTIYLCFDMDDAGRQACEALIPRLGRHRCRIVNLPHKDANECLQKGLMPEKIKQYILNAQSLDPDELKAASLFVDRVITCFEDNAHGLSGIAPPWEKAKDKIAFRNSELSLWTGINGHGKSQFLGHLLVDHMRKKSTCMYCKFRVETRAIINTLNKTSWRHQRSDKRLYSSDSRLVPRQALAARHCWQHQNRSSHRDFYLRLSTLRHQYVFNRFPHEMRHGRG